jgi:hypothetical protein
MKRYYWEKADSLGSFMCESDTAAIELAKKIGVIQVLYCESDTNDGQPLVIVQEAHDGD